MLKVAPTADLDAIYDMVVEVTEEALCSTYDKMEHFNYPDQSFCGRNDFRIVNRRTIPPLHKVYGALGRAERGLGILVGTLEGWLQQLRAALRDGATAARLKLMEAARAALTRPRGALAAFLGAHPGWDFELAFLLEQPDDWRSVVVGAARLCSGLRAFADAQWALRASERSRHFNLWVDEQLRTGAGAIHRMVKPGHGEIEPPVSVCGGQSGREWSARPSDILRVEGEAWGKVWYRHAGAKAPWREGQGQPVGQALPPSALMTSGKRLRESSRVKDSRASVPGGFCTLRTGRWRWFATF